MVETYRDTPLVMENVYKILVEGFVVYVNEKLCILGCGFFNLQIQSSNPPVGKKLQELLVALFYVFYKLVFN